METQASPSTLEQVLTRLNEEGKFSTSVLAGDDGLPVASSPTSPVYDPDTIAVMVTRVKELFEKTQERLGLERVDEVSIVVSNRSRLICRYFKVDNLPLVLVIVAPPNASYRRLSTRAIAEIKAAWR